MENDGISSPGQRSIDSGDESVEVDAISQCMCGKPFKNDPAMFRRTVVIHIFEVPRLKVNDPIG